MNMVSSPVISRGIEKYLYISLSIDHEFQVPTFARVARVIRKSHPSIQVDVSHGLLPRVMPSTGSTVELCDEPLDDPCLELRSVTWVQRSSGWVVDLV